LTQFLFGAKRSRVNPIRTVETLVVSLSEKPFNVSPPYLSGGKFNDYINEVVATASSYKRALELRDNVAVVGYFSKGLLDPSMPKAEGVSFEVVNNPPEVFNRIKNTLDNLIRNKRI
jgi:CRISPR/Cas system-associated protein Cas7 (RAMP superfamily)